MSQHLEELVTHGVRHWGRFDERPVAVNPLEEYLGVTRRAKRLRLKEWIGWTLMHPELSSSMILQDAHYLASSELYVRDAATGRLTEHARNAGGGSLRLPEMLYNSAPSIDKKGYRVAYEFGPKGGTHRIQAEVEGTEDQLPVTVDLVLDGSRASAALSVSQPLAPRGAMYTHKIIFPTSGTITVGDHTYVFDGDRDLAILDEHKTFLPYRTTWLWGTFAQFTPAGIVGANFCQRPMQPGTEEESCLWVPTPAGPVAAPLNDVVFTADSDDSLSPWKVRSGDGSLDLTFTPDGRKDVKHQLVLFAIDYWQLYGTYSGTVTAGGASHAVDAVRGVLENMNARL